ncbi:hypothetical protein TWF788_004665 [Orbilia oligospora]|uniref:Uncharacterized protein n=1 Tax=Orbilia oligospora TaxID=2813651 RepID=A0A7C8U0K2_ORBOL|nr:hypothetical protein TWF788_004665 [Orbilia oligospora]
MGQYWSSWSHNSFCTIPNGLPQGFPVARYLSGGISALLPSPLRRTSSMIIQTPEGLLNTLRKFDMVGLVVKSNSPPPGPRKLYIIGEDEICDSIVSRCYVDFWAVYPARYKGSVQYYIGCEAFQVETFQRPKHLDIQSPERVRDLENLNIRPQDWSVAYKKSV